MAKDASIIFSNSSEKSWQINSIYKDFNPLEINFLTRSRSWINYSLFPALPFFDKFWQILLETAEDYQRYFTPERWFTS